MTITLSHGGPTIFVAEAPSTELLVGTAGGIARLRKDGGRWAVADHSLTDKHISALLVEPVSGTLFAGAYNGSLRASEDGGKTWEERASGLAYDDIYSLATRRLADGTVVVYCGTEPAHLYESRDLGRSWRELSGVRDVGGLDKWTFPAPPHVAHLKHITFDPRSSEVIYASVEQGGLLKSTDGGETWRDMDGVDDDVHRVVVSPARPDRLYITGGDGMYVSEDGGETWSHWETQESTIGGYPDQLVFRPSRPDEMYIASAQSNPGFWHESHFAGTRISRSDDAGKTWQQLTSGLPDRLASSIEAMALEDWGQGFAIFAATTLGEVWATEDSGASWSCVVDGLAPVSKAGHYMLLTAT
jgi:photosystem II stability/assembly factor-like uncharacterized protein